MGAGQMNVGIIGTGFGRRVVAPVFDATDGCTVAGVVSARDEAAIAAMVARPDVDLVSVHSPPFLHAPHVRAALQAGKAVLCDKPFALDAAEAADVEAEARLEGVIALCNFEFRYQPTRGLVRELIAAATIGAVEHVQWTHLSSGSRVPLRRWGWLFDRELGGGWIGAWASHAVDTLRFVCSAEIGGVRGVRRIDVAERPDADGDVHVCTAEDGLTAVLTLAGGATVAIDSSFAAAANVVPRVTVFGSRGVIEVVADERITIRSGEAAPEHVDFATADDDRHREPMRRFAEVVRDAIHTGEVPEHAPTFADGRACDEVLDRLRAQPLATTLT